jgi:hypothetical protein
VRAYLERVSPRLEASAGKTSGARIAAGDAFRVVKLGSTMVDEVRHRVQQDTLGHRGRKGDPLYGNQRRHRNNPQNRPRLPQFHQLRNQMPPRSWRPPPLPDQNKPTMPKCEGPAKAN